MRVDASLRKLSKTEASQNSSAEFDNIETTVWRFTEMAVDDAVVYQPTIRGGSHYGNKLANLEETKKYGITIKGVLPVQPRHNVESLALSGIPQDPDIFVCFEDRCLDT